MAIHATAIIDKKAEISQDAEIGPYAVIEDNVKIGKGVKIAAHVYICRNTEIGEGTNVYVGAVLGNVPQDIAFKGKETFLKIGKQNTIREYVTVHRGSKEGSATIVGDNNFIMVAAHIGHNCIIHNNVIIANSTLLAGHITVEDGVFISGNVVVHQHAKIGRLALIGGFTGVNKDVPPYMLVRGPSVVWGINLIGLRRAKFSREVIREIKEAYNLVYCSGLNTEHAIAKIQEAGCDEEVSHFIEFIKGSKRGICKYRFDAEDNEFFDVSKKDTVK